MAYTGKATSAQAGSIRLPQTGVAAPASFARRLGAVTLKAALLLLFAVPLWAQQTFTGGPFVIPANGDGSNSTVRQTIPIAVATASAIRNISIPLGFRHSPEFEFLSQTGCAVDGKTVNAAGTICSVVIRFAPTAPGMRSAQIRVIDGDGNVSYLGISGTGFVPQAAIFPALSSIVAGSGPNASGYTGDGAIATAAQMNAPEGVVSDTFGNTYIADTANNVVRMLDAFGNITTIAGTGNPTYTGDSGPAAAATLNGPTWLAIDAAQNLYISDSGNNVVRKVAADSSRTISTVAGTGTAEFFGDGGPATNAKLNNPRGIALDPFGNLYIADSTNRRIRKVDAVTGNISTIAGSPQQGFDASPVAALSAHFNAPTGIAIDTASNLYIADTGNSAVREWVAESNTVIVYAGTGIAGKTGNGAAATLAMFNGPTGIALNAAGDVYIADTGNDMVRRIEHSTGIVDLYLGRSKTGYTTGVEPSNEVGLANPTGLAFDSSQNFLAIDTANNVVREVSPLSGAVQFSATSIGSTTAPQTVTVSNIGTTNLSFAGVPLTLANSTTSTNFNLVTTSATPCGGNIAAGGHCTFTVSFAPQTTGFIAGEIDATDNSLTSFTPTTVQPVYLFGGPIATITITPTTLPDAVPNTPYSVTLTANGGFGALTLEEVGTLPIGINVGTDGNKIIFTGTPTSTGVYPLTVFATDSLGNTASQAMSLRVAPPPITVNVNEAITGTDTPQILNAINVNVTEAIQGTDTPLVLPTITVNVAEAIQGVDTPAILPTLTVNVTETIGAQDTPTTALSAPLLPQTINVGQLPTLTYGGGPFTIPVTATSGLPITLTVISGPVSGSSPYTITGAGIVMFHAVQSGNQTYAATSLDFNVKINPAPLTFTAKSFTRIFGQPNPPLTYDLTGFVLGQNANVLSGTPAISTTAKGISPAGSYPITISTGTLAAANYSFNFVPGTLTVSTGSAPQTILFGEIPNLHKEQTMLLTAHATSGLPVSYSITGPATLSGPNLTVTGTGRVIVTATQAGNANYAAAPPVARSFIAQ